MSRMYGLLGVSRRHLRVVTCLYVLLAVIAMALPAALAKPRGGSPHPISEPSRRSP